MLKEQRLSLRPKEVIWFQEKIQNSTRWYDIIRAKQLGTWKHLKAATTIRACIYRQILMATTKGGRHQLLRIPRPKQMKIQNANNSQIKNTQESDFQKEKQFANCGHSENWWLHQHRPQTVFKHEIACAPALFTDKTQMSWKYQKRMQHASPEVQRKAV